MSRRQWLELEGRRRHVELCDRDELDIGGGEPRLELLERVEHLRGEG